MSPAAHDVRIALDYENISVAPILPVSTQEMSMTADA